MQRHQHREDVKDIYLCNFGDNVTKYSYTAGYMLTIHHVFLEYTILANKMSLMNVGKIHKAIEHVVERY